MLPGEMTDKTLAGYNLFRVMLIGLENLFKMNAMGTGITISEEFDAARNAYQEQIEFGTSSNTALNLATIVYQQRNPFVSACEARARVAEALGIHSKHDR